MQRTMRSGRGWAAAIAAIGLWAWASGLLSAGEPPASGGPPEGFVALFNGQDLGGWKGLVADPPSRARMLPQELAEAQEKADEQMRQHWRVEAGELVNDGHGPHLCTKQDYGDFELSVDWKISPGADSGIYLRGTPQVQIWDPEGPHGPARVGSGGLYNNQRNPSAPLVRADLPAGQWNRFHIRMLGERVTVVLNGQLVADNVAMENYWERGRPIDPSGQIELQTHGGEVRFRNIHLRQISAEEADRVLLAEGSVGSVGSVGSDGSDGSDGSGGSDRSGGFVPLFNGQDLAGWVGAGWAVEEGLLVCPEGTGGLLRSDGEFADFAIRFQFRLPPGGNNGLVIRSGPGGPLGDGLEIQILDDSAQKHRDLQPYQYHGSIYGAVAAQRGYQRPVGQWNFEEVVCKGPRITVRLNGTTIVDADVSTIDQPANPAVKAGLQRRSGHVGFLGRGDRVEFRHILIRRLD